jgi:hypothetical protein
MRRLPLLALVLSVMAAVAALWVLLRAEPQEPEPVMPPEAEHARATPDQGLQHALPVQGGVYAGRVLDLEDHPIPGAHVLLVAYDAGGPDTLGHGEQEEETDPDVVPDVPVVGSMSVGGEGIADKDGRFKIAADSQSLITRVLAYGTGHFLDVVNVDHPRGDIVLHLQPAGRVIGTVVDDATGQPVPGAVVSIYLQQIVSPVPEGVGTHAAFKRKTHPLSWLSTLGSFIGRDLGPRIWDVVDSHDETLRLVTDANGHFEIGPLGNSVQLEFVITHPLYKWIDFDTDDGKHTPKRLVVEPGQTVERTFRLEKGLYVAGQVVDAQGKGLPDVFVKDQSISAYYRHWWYKHKWRRARTDRNGHFRIDGLAKGSQQLIFMHPSFGQKVVSVKAGTDDLMVVADPFGALQGTLTGVTPSPHRRRISAHFEALGEKVEGARHEERRVILDPHNHFLVKRLHPGRYRVWVQAGSQSSLPVDLEITALALTDETFDVGAGGVLLARVVDAHGGIVEPANARLVALVDGRERPMGSFVTREGELEVEGVAPGSYRLRVSAPGRLSTTTEPFTISAGGDTQIGAIMLLRYAYLKFGQPVNERGRPAKMVQELVIEYRLGSDGAWQRVRRAGLPVPIKPGHVEIRAHSGKMSFLDAFDVEGGETHPVVIRLDDGR